MRSTSSTVRMWRGSRRWSFGRSRSEAGFDWRWPSRVAHLKKLFKATKGACWGVGEEVAGVVGQGDGRERVERVSLRSALRGCVAVHGSGSTTVRQRGFLFALICVFGRFFFRSGIGALIAGVFVIFLTPADPRLTPARGPPGPRPLPVFPRPVAVVGWCFQLLNIDQARHEGLAVLALAVVEQLVDEALASAAAVQKHVFHLGQAREMEL